MKRKPKLVACILIYLSVIGREIEYWLDKKKIEIKKAKKEMKYFYFLIDCRHVQVKSALLNVCVNAVFEVL